MSGRNRGGDVQHVPWRTWEEWAEVCEDVLTLPANAFLMLSRTASPDVRHYYACDLMLVWEARGRVPTAVAATRSLLEVWCGLTPAASRPAALAVAIVRLVNGLVSPFHGASAANIGSVAGKLGLSALLVELRHAISHAAAVPSEEQLLQGAAAAWDWLLQSYWEPQRRAAFRPADSAAAALAAYKRTAAAEQMASGKSDPALFDRKKDAAALLLSQLTGPVLASSLVAELVPSEVPRRVKSVPVRLRRAWWYLLTRLDDEARHALLLHLAQHLAHAELRHAKAAASLACAWLLLLLETWRPPEPIFLELLAALNPPGKRAADLLSRLNRRFGVALGAESRRRIGTFLGLWTALQESRKGRAPLPTDEAAAAAVDEDDGEAEADADAEAEAEELEAAPAAGDEEDGSAMEEDEVPRPESWSAAARVPVGVGYILPHDRPTWRPSPALAPQETPAAIWTHLHVWN